MGPSAELQQQQGDKQRALNKNEDSISLDDFDLSFLLDETDGGGSGGGGGGGRPDRTGAALHLAIRVLKLALHEQRANAAQTVAPRPGSPANGGGNSPGRSRSPSNKRERSKRHTGGALMGWSPFHA